MKPNYTKIYLDIIKYKNKESMMTPGLYEKINNIKIVNDILEIEKELFDNNDFTYNQRLKSYDETTIMGILNFQREKRLTNTELGEIYNISRNTIAKWKKVYQCSVY